MPTPLDFLRAKVQAYKHILDGKTAKEKEKHVSTAVAEEFNGLLEEIKKAVPETAPHLPQPITSTSFFARDLRVSDVKYLDLELLLSQVLAVLDVLRENR
jgi:hypothetical protein